MNYEDGDLQQYYTSDNFFFGVSYLFFPTLFSELDLFLVHTIQVFFSFIKYESCIN